MWFIKFLIYFWGGMSHCEFHVTDFKAKYFGRASSWSWRLGRTSITFRRTATSFLKVGPN
jgi:hypothetical protein